MQGQPSRRVMFGDNALVDSASDHGRLAESMFGPVLLPDKGAP
jgi:hypothetical protein